mgnify:CR=1 FL=1
MSYEMQDRVWEIDLPSSAKLVLLALAYRADASGSCYPSLSGLCNLTGMDVKTIRKAIRSLVAEGLLEVVGRGGRSPLYRVTPTKNGTTKFGTPTNIDPSQNWEDTPTKNGRTPLPNLVPEHINNKSYNKSNIYAADCEDVFDPVSEQIENINADHVIDLQDEPEHILAAHEMCQLAKAYRVKLNNTERIKAIANRQTVTVRVFKAVVDSYKKEPRSTGWLVTVLDTASRDTDDWMSKNTVKPNLFIEELKAEGLL